MKREIHFRKQHIIDKDVYFVQTHHRSFREGIVFASASIFSNMYDYNPFNCGEDEMP